MSSDDEIQNDNNVDLKHLFSPAGFPAGFFFHESVIDHAQRAHVTSLIELHGGVVLEDFVDADTVLVHPGYNNTRILEIGLNACEKVITKNIYVEKIWFIQSCIRSGKFAHRPRTIQPMGGARGPRTEFTSEDDDRLAYYLAVTVPDTGAGGLQGDKIYQTLVEIGETVPKNFGWVKRHTWQSWQNRYKKNMAYFNKKMAKIRNRSKSSPSGPQLFPFDRRITKQNQRAYGVERLPSESGDEQLDVEEEGEFEDAEGSTLAGGNSPKRRRPSERHSLPLAKSLKKRKIPATNSDYVPRRKQYASPEYEGAVNMDMDEAEVPSSGQDGVYIPDNAHYTPQYPSPLLVAVPEPSDFDLGPQLSMHQTPVLSAIDLTVHSPEFTDLLDFNATSNPDDDTTASTIVVNPSQLHKQQSPIQPQTTTQLQRKTRSSNPQVANDAPFRNTRARSRSVDQHALRSEELPARKRRKLQTAPRANELESLIEAVDHPDEAEFIRSERMTANETAAVDSASFTSIISEERDVERILVPETMNSSTASRQTVGTEKSQSISQQSQTLRSEDAPYDTLNESLTDIDPVDILREYDAGVKARWSLTPALATSSGSGGRAADSHGHSEPQQPVHRMRNQLATATPKVKTPRAWSRSPTPDSFPLPGTRAREFRDKVERTEKNTPYKPPAGTRAAK